MLTRWLILFAVALAAQGQGFRAGVAKADLDPELGMPMSGFGARTGVSKGVLDPLQARVLALSDGSHTLALVTLDLVFPIDPPEMERIRAAARGKGIEEVIFHASHTHSGPTYSANRQSYEKAVNRILQAVLAAASVMVPVKTGTGWGVAYIGHNRRQVLFDGEARMFWRDETRVSTFPVDPTVGVIRLDRENGTPLAILVNYACHAVVLGPENLLYSADYPSEMRNTIEQGFHNAPMAFFLQGAPGDINPYYDKTALLEDAVERMREIGRKLGEEALRVARRIRTDTVAHPAIRWKTASVRVKCRWDVDQVMAMLRQRYGRDADRAARLLRPEMDLPVTTLLLNGEMAFVAMPGEPFVEFQMQLRSRSPLPQSYLLGYTDGTFGYFPTIAAAVRGGYGANNYSTVVEVGAGERMLDAGLISLYELLGKLSPRPGQP